MGSGMGGNIRVAGGEWTTEGEWWVGSRRLQVGRWVGTDVGGRVARSTTLPLATGFGPPPPTHLESSAPLLPLSFSYGLLRSFVNDSVLHDEDDIFHRADVRYGVAL